ncbi:MAG TPA: cytochrome c peroxidase [Planctomycetaceae bacterium]|jgi:DNA-binding beta-propeller fold protein YncE
MIENHCESGLVVLLLLGTALAQAAEPQAVPGNVGFRGPAALIVSADGQRVLTANRRSGTISIVDPVARRVISETAVGKKLSSLVSVPRTALLLTTDEAEHVLILASQQGDRIQVVARLPVAAYPVSVVCRSDGQRCYVVSLWSRQLSVVDIEPARGGNSPAVVKLSRLKLSQVVSLPFAPRKLALFEPGQRLIIGGAFGGQLAVVETQRHEIESVRELPAHNIRGLTISADGTRLLVAHQVLNSLARTTPDDVHWGLLMDNVVRSLELGKIGDKQADPLSGSTAHPVGDAWLAGADPGPLASLPDGRVVIALGGVGEIGLLREDESRLTRIPTVRRPTDVADSPDASRIFVADELADEVGVIDVASGEPLGVISLGPRPTLSLADRGERLFYSGELSHGGWMSCHSCHPDGHTNGLLNDNLGDGNFGAPKRVLSLLGVGRTGPWAWNGGVADLETQIKKSIETTMRGKAPSDDQVRALAAFLQALPAAPEIATVDQDAIARGKSVFESHRCSRCHAPPEYTSAATYDVGLKDELGHSLFNPPSLRGVRHSDRLFHDNRARSLDEVFTRFKHQLNGDLSSTDLADLLAFLRSL